MAQDVEKDNEDSAPSSREAGWYLEGYVDESNTVHRIPLAPFPFRIGRLPDSELHLSFESISKNHAEIYQDGNSLRIRDLGSTNGTFVNHKRAVSEMALQDEDILHFSHVMFRVHRQKPSKSGSEDFGGTVLLEEKYAERLLAGPEEIQQLIVDRSVIPYFQPIVKIFSGQTIGYEVLGRGNVEGLPTSPLELFMLASTAGLEVELSTIFRWEGIRLGKKLPGSPILFVNMHPTETRRPGMIESLRELRNEEPNLPITLEIHEGSITDLAVMRELSAALHELEIGLAYDDFGAGQARFIELVEVPPDILKFDIGLVRDIHEAPKQKLQMVRSLVKMTLDLGIAPLVEGIEQRQEAEVFAEFGVDLAQGYFYAKPAPVTTFMMKV